ncbi:hypothetical protein ACEPPN_003285 [Leptodophora sp. 'Broadleaf-Isolate-01']
MRLGKRRLLDYNKIWELLVPSETGYKKFLTWAEYDNQIVKDLLSQDVPGSSVSLSTPSRDSFLQEIIWVLETRQILFQSMMSLVTHSFGEKVYASTTKQAFRPHDVEKIKTIQAVYDTTRLNIKNLQQCLGPEASNAMISPTVLGKVSTDSILELAIQCILNTINPDTDIRDVVESIKGRFANRESPPYFCHGPATLFFSRSETGLLVGGSTPRGMNGKDAASKGISDYISEQRKAMLQALDTERSSSMEHDMKLPEWFPQAQETELQELCQSIKGLYPDHPGIAVTPLRSGGRAYFEEIAPCEKCRPFYRFQCGVEMWKKGVWFTPLDCAEDSWELKREECWYALITESDREDEGEDDGTAASGSSGGGENGWWHGVVLFVGFFFICFRVFLG